MNDPNGNDTKKRFSSGLFWGLLLGLLIGIFAITALTEYFFKIKSFFRTPRAEKKHELVLQEIISENNKSLTSIDNINHDSLPAIDSTTYTFYWNYYINRPGYKELDSLTLDSLIKSRISDSIALDRKYEEKIMRESVLNSILKLTVASQPENTNSVIDTTGNKKDTPGQVQVEIWDSPDQSRHYVWKKEILKLYGVYSHEAIQPLFYKHAWYLSLNNQYYNISREKYLKPLRPVSSSEVIHELNEIIKTFRSTHKNRQNGGTGHEKS